jgi:hypothetical protein
MEGAATAAEYLNASQDHYLAAEELRRLEPLVLTMEENRLRALHGGGAQSKVVDQMIARHANDPNIAR